MDSGTYQLVSEQSIPGNQGDPARKKMEVRSESMENRLDAVEQRIEGLEVKTAKVLEQLEVMRAQLRDLQGISGDLDPPWKPTLMEDQRTKEWNEKLNVDSEFQKLVVVVNHQNQKKEEESKIENAGNREGDSINELVSAIAKPEGNENGGDLEPPNQQSTMEAQVEEKSPEESTLEDAMLEEPDRGTIMAKNGYGEIVISRVTEVRGRWEVEEMVRMSYRAVERLGDDEHWGRPPEENAGGATATEGGAATEEWPDGDSEESVFSLTTVGCDTEREEKRIRVGWRPLDQKFNSLGQAQSVTHTSQIHK